MTHAAVSHRSLIPTCPCSRCPPVRLRAPHDASNDDAGQTAEQNLQPKVLPTSTGALYRSACST